MPESVLILGGAGFIGSHLACLHDRVGDEVHIGVRPGWRRPSPDFLPGITATEADLGDVEQIEDLFATARPTIVYHLASSHPHSAGAPTEPYSDNWTIDLRNLQRIASVARRYRPEIKAFVRAGSLAEYGNAVVPSREDEREDPPTLYGLALAMGTQYLRFIQRELPFKAVTARLGLTYGVGQSEKFLVPMLLRSCVSGESFHVREPAARRDMILVDDVARGLMAIGRRDLPGGSIVNLCSGVALSNWRIAEAVCAAAGADPGLLTFGPEQANPSVIWGSTAKARELLGFSARHTFAEGIERTVRTLTAGSC
jgi:UDP-glucose 4-epimerase